MARTTSLPAATTPTRRRPTSRTARWRPTRRLRGFAGFRGRHELAREHDRDADAPRTAPAGNTTRERQRREADVSAFKTLAGYRVGFRIAVAAATIGVIYGYD